MSFSWQVAWHYLRTQTRAKNKRRLRWGTLFFFLLTLIVFGIDVLCQKYNGFEKISFFLNHGAKKWFSVDLDVKAHSVFLGILYLKYITPLSTVLVGVAIELLKRFTIFTMVSLYGLFLGTATLLIVIGVQNGMNKDIVDKVLGMHAHLVIKAKENEQFLNQYQELLTQVKKIDGVAAASPYLAEDMFLFTEGNLSQQAVIAKGIDPIGEGDITDLNKMIKTGSLQSLLETNQKQEPTKKLQQVRSKKMYGIMIGSELARNLFGMMDNSLILGQKMSLASMRGDMGPTGEIPFRKDFYVVGIFRSGFYEYDSAFVYLNLKDMQNMMGVEDEIMALGIKAKSLDRVDEVKEKIKNLLGDSYEVTTWQERNQALFSVLKLEERVMFYVLWIIVMVAALSLVGNSFMLVWEKKKEIGMLKAMGATSVQIARIFLALGLMIGVIGIAMGCFCGVITCMALRVFGLPLDTNLWYIINFPIFISFREFFGVLGGSLGLVLLAIFYPAWIASRLSPLETWRN